MSTSKVARLAAVAEQAADDAVEAAEIAHDRAKSIPKPEPPDPRDAPFYALLRGDDGGVFARMSPRRRRWPALEQIDARIAEIDGQQAACAAELEHAREQRKGAEVRHQLAIADWIAAGQPDPQPMSEAAGLDSRIYDLEAQHAAFDIIRDRLFEERVAHVVKRRKNLVDDAEKATQERLSRCLELVDELEQAREDLIALRHTTVWASLYPSPALANEVPYTNCIVGARLSLQERHLPGIRNQLQAPSVFALIRDDARHCAAALTVDQAAEIQGSTTGAISGREAKWQDRRVEQDQQRRDNEVARERFRQEWGYDPPEFK